MFNTFPGSVADSVSGGAKSKTFLADGTFYVPEGVRYLQVSMAGGGGSGAQDSVAGDGSGGGGGAEWYSDQLVDLGVLPPGSIAVVVGAGGVGLVAAGAGNDGGDTTFGTFLTALGGGGPINTGIGGDGSDDTTLGGVGGTSDNDDAGDEPAGSVSHGYGGGGGSGATTGTQGYGGGSSHRANGGSPATGELFGGGGASYGSGGDVVRAPGYGGGGEGGGLTHTSQRDGGAGFVRVEWNT